MSTFLDTNVLLEVLLPGRPKAKAAARYALRESVVSPLTAHLYVYFGEKEGFPLESLMRNLALLKFTDLGDTQVRWAITNCQGDDFEDALQVACAVTYGSVEFVTLDKSLALRYG
ncbi:MAG: type II toxin-antitoxin system VapC family toxin, partial [Acidimicrobiales bacterium]|nr:type II toxin-antitoxin system VapC family toxin [Acidimicrobiales bacterium]